VDPAVSASPVDLLAQEPEERPFINLSVRDTSRFEWSTSLPLPAHGHFTYEIDCQFELPWTGSRRSPWDQLEGLTRLEGPSTIATSEDTTIDAVRQRVLALLEMLRRTREGFARHCCAVADGKAQTTEPEPHEFLTVWLDAALVAFADARSGVARAASSDSPEISRERALADEFLSVRLLDFLADAQRITNTTVGAIPSPSPQVVSALAVVDERLARALDEEIAYRAAKGFPRADPDSPAMLERYVERAGRLKKHFQELLLLDREVRHVNERVQQWLTSAAALLAGALYFFMQLVIARFPHASTQSLGTGLIVLALLAGLTYLIRDRLKELTRAWLTGKVYRYHAQRIVRSRVPVTRLKTRDVIVQAREWCNETSIRRPDPLNPESGAVLHVTLVEHLQRGRVMAQPTLTASGVHGIRHVTRYDLSPLFSSLQDAVKSVAVLDPESHRVRFVDAPRRYQIPVRVVLTMTGLREERVATLVIDKQGIVRLDPARASELAENGGHDEP
jgi:hypothetical protein